MFTHLSDECNCAVMLCVSSLEPLSRFRLIHSFHLEIANAERRNCTRMYLCFPLNESILISSFCCLLYYVVFIRYGRHCCLCDDFSNLHPRWSNLCASSMQYVTETPTGHWPVHVHVHVQPTSIDDRNTLLGQLKICKLLR